MYQSWTYIWAYICLCIYIVRNVWYEPDAPPCKTIFFLKRTFVTGHNFLGRVRLTEPRFCQNGQDFRWHQSVKYFVSITYKAQGVLEKKSCHKNVSKLNQHCLATAKFTAPGKASYARKPCMKKWRQLQNQAWPSHIKLFGALISLIFYSEFLETSFKALQGLERKMKYCKSLVCTRQRENAPHSFSSLMVTHAFLAASSVVGRGRWRTHRFFNFSTSQQFRDPLPLESVYCTDQELTANCRHIFYRIV